MRIGSCACAGFALVQLTTETKAERQPALSPDGKKVAFVSERDGKARALRVELDGTGSVNVTMNPAADDEAVWGFAE
jgi:Tol biopolymer transport system component